MKSQKKLALPLCKGKEECEGVTKRGGIKNNGSPGIKKRCNLSLLLSSFQ